jgi:hypothetical protein
MRTDLRLARDKSSNPDSLELDADREVSIETTNTEEARTTFRLRELDVDTDTIGPGGRATQRLRSQKRLTDF